MGDEFHGESRGVGQMNGAPTDVTLRAESILLKALDIATESARQSFEAREHLLNLCLLLVGALATGLGALYQFGDGAHSLMTPVTAIILFAASLLSATLFGTYVARRNTYLESLVAANLIVEYYIRHIKPLMPDIEDALRWRLTNIPALRRFDVARFVSGYPMALGGNLCLGAATLISCNLLLDSGLPLLPSGSSRMLVATIAAVGVFSISSASQAVYFLRVANRQRQMLAALTSQPLAR